MKCSTVHCETDNRQHRRHVVVNGNSVSNVIVWHWAGDRVILKYNFTYSCVADFVFMTMYNNYRNTTLPDCFLCLENSKICPGFPADKCHLPGCWFHFVIASFSHNIISNFTCHWGHIKSDVCVNHLCSLVLCEPVTTWMCRWEGFLNIFFFWPDVLKSELCSCESEQPDSQEHSCRYEECSFSSPRLSRWVFLDLYCFQIRRIMFHLECWFSQIQEQ